MQVIEAETEAAHWQEELKAKQQQFEEEMEKHRQEAELLRVSVAVFADDRRVGSNGSINGNFCVAWYLTGRVSTPCFTKSCQMYKLYIYM